ncbi:MAG: hypothetical protein JOZ99_12070 [Actinobacteria bacterium]|nr:hypothetical protein [Actinomycetota bacterium]
MDDKGWERYGAVGGLVFAVLLLLSTFMVPAPPHVDASTLKIAKYFLDHPNRILASQVIGLFAVLGFVWFAAHLRTTLRAAETVGDGLAALVFGSGIALAALGALASVPNAVLAFGAKQRSEVITNAGFVRGMFDMNLMLGNVLTVLLGLFVAAAAYAMLRREVAMQWLGAAGVVVALVAFVAGGTGFFVTKQNGGVVAIGFVAFLGFLAFVVVTSIWMLLPAHRSRAYRAVPAPVT